MSPTVRSVLYRLLLFINVINDLGTHVGQSRTVGDSLEWPGTVCVRLGQFASVSLPESSYALPILARRPYTVFRLIIVPNHHPSTPQHSRVKIPGTSKFSEPCYAPPYGFLAAEDSYRSARSLPLHRRPVDRRRCGELMPKWDLILKIIFT